MNEGLGRNGQSVLAVSAAESSSSTFRSVVLLKFDYWVPNHDECNGEWVLKKSSSE